MGSPGFPAWLDAARVSLAYTTYQSSRLMFLGLDQAGGLSGFERVFDRAMGLHATADRLLVASRHQIWRLENLLAPGQMHNGYDRLYSPISCHVTGDLDVHDLVARPGSDPERPTEPVFVATRFNCLATVSARHSFRPLWKPPFISAIAGEDRCHLNGLALVNGEPRYLTMCGRGDTAGSWREQRHDGGCVIDMANNEIVAAGLCMPHSPRYYRNQLWLLNAGTGEFGRIDRATGRFEPVCFCPGFLRGLCFSGDHAVVGLSRSRQQDGTFTGLPLQERLAADGDSALCGFLVIDLHRGAVVESLRLEGDIDELYDVQLLPGVRRPMAFGLLGEEISRYVTVEDDALEPGSPEAGRPSPVSTTPATGAAAPAMGARAAVASEFRASATALVTEGSRLKNIGQGERAEQLYRQALALHPYHLGALNNLGNLMCERERYSESLAFFDQALALDPSFVEGITNRGALFQVQGELEMARQAYEQALALDPDHLNAHINLAGVYKQQGRLRGALDQLAAAARLDPLNLESLFQRGQILEYMDDVAGAEAAYQAILERDPSQRWVNLFLGSLELRLCRWNRHEELRELALSACCPDPDDSLGFRRPGLLLLMYLGLPNDVLLRAARQCAAGHTPRHGHLTQRRHLPPPEDRPLRVGLISGDFRNHAVGRLIFDLLPRFDRQQVHLYCYSTVDMRDVITDRISGGSELFRNLAPLSAQAAAQRIQDDDVDLLIDLAGHTIGNGGPILAYRPAPVQATFLGYPGTTGADYIDFAIGDRWILCPEVLEHYSEQPILLEHAFFGSPLEPAPERFPRAHYQLPEHGIVFACFNQHHKFNPELIEAWAEILQRSTGSVLWLLEGHTPATATNLKTEFEDRGIDPQRVIFRPRLAYADYLASYDHVDLFLDTFVYSAGSTAVAAISRGVPMLTRAGTSNASRMGASINAAAGLEELICSSTRAYIDTAVDLAADPNRLRLLKQTLLRDRDALPLFDLDRFARGFEVACMEMTQAGARQGGWP